MNKKKKKSITIGIKKTRLKQMLNLTHTSTEWLSCDLTKKTLFTEKNICKTCGGNLRVGVKRVPLWWISYFSLMTQPKGSGLSQSASEEGWKHIYYPFFFFFCLVFPLLRYIQLFFWVEQWKCHVFPNISVTVSRWGNYLSLEGC